jgi:hypothetical protein
VVVLLGCFRSVEVEGEESGLQVMLRGTSKADAHRLTIAPSDDALQCDGARGYEEIDRSPLAPREHSMCEARRGSRGL